MYIHLNYIHAITYTSNRRNSKNVGIQSVAIPTKVYHYSEAIEN